MKNLFRDYRLEIVLILLALIVILLFIEPFGIAGALQDWVTGLFTAVGELAITTYRNVSEWYSGVPTTTLLVFIAALTIVGLLIYRIRSRILKSAVWRATVCPVCQSPLHRTKRSGIDRFLARTMLPHARRYICSNEECRWTGLRHHIHRKNRAGFNGGQMSSD
jgi:hypothetical protein